MESGTGKANFSVPILALVPNHRQKALTEFVDKEEFSIRLLPNTEKVLQQIEALPFSLVLIEANETATPATELCAQIQNQSRAVVVVIAAADFASGRISYWRFGADLVLASNSSIDEIFWACRNLSQRMLARKQINGRVNQRGSGEWFFEQQSFRLIRKDGTWVRLSRNEAQIMSALCNSCNKVVKRNVLWQLLDKADWRYNDRTLDVLIARIRAKMRQVNIDPSVILTHYGAGYELRTNR